jgi:hypothetical protein
LHTYEYEVKSVLTSIAILPMNRILINKEKIRNISHNQHIGWANLVGLATWNFFLPFIIFYNIPILPFIYIIFFNLLFFTIFFRFFYKPEHFTKCFVINKIYFGHKYKYILATNTKYIFLQSINQCDILVMNFTL